MTAKQCGVSLNLVTEGPQAQSLSPSVTWDSYDVKRNPDFKVGKRRNDDFPAAAARDAGLLRRMPVVVEAKDCLGFKEGLMLEFEKRDLSSFRDCFAAPSL
ncbi:hypothetical protein AAC387_Pa10g1446 [Persea americana]